MMSSDSRVPKEDVEPSPVDTPAPFLSSSAALVPHATNTLMTGGSPSTTTNNNMTTTLSLLQDVVDGAAFEETVKERTRARRQQQNMALSQLRVKVQRLEAALSGESKRRMESHRLTSQEAKKCIEQVYEKLHKQIEDDQKVTNERLTALETGLQELQEQWERNVNELQSSISEVQSGFKRSMDNLQSQVQHERSSRMHRQDQLEKQIQSLSLETQDRWKTERQERIIAIDTLISRLDEQDSHRDQQLKAYEASIRKELELLEDELHRETEERQCTDDEIVAGLNRYIQQVQKSLSYVSGV